MKKFVYFLGVCLLSCSTQQDSNEEIVITEKTKGTAPIISSLTADLEDKFAGDTITIIANVTDLDVDITSYQWTVSDGSYEKVTDSNITWNSPLGDDTYTIKLTVTDSEGHVTSKSLDISLQSRPQTFQKFVEAYYHRLYSGSKIEIIDDFIYLYSAEANGYGTAFRLKKLDSDGNVLWTKTYDNFPESNRKIGRLFRTPDNKLMLGIDGETLKVNTDGDVLWRFPNQNLFNFVETLNGNYFFIGAINDGEWKSSYNVISPNGELIREGIIETDYAIHTIYDIAEGPDTNSYFVLAWVSIPENPDVISEVLHIDSNGNILNTIGFGYHPRIYGRLFKEADGSYSAFYSSDVGSIKPVTRVHFSGSGEILGTNTYSFESHNEGLDIEQLDQGGYLIAGNLGPSYLNYRSLIFKTTPLGEVDWNIEYGQNTNDMDFASSIQVFSDGKILVSGSIYDPEIGDNDLKVYLHKYNPDGSL